MAQPTDYDTTISRRLDTLVKRLVFWSRVGFGLAATLLTGVFWGTYSLSDTLDRLVGTNAELAATRARLEATIEQHALELSRRELRRADLDPSDRDFLDAEATRLTPNPATAEDHYILGVSAFLNEDYETAHDEYTLALSLEMTGWMYIWHAALILLRNGSTGKLSKTCPRAFVLPPKEQIFMRPGVLLFEIGPPG